MDPFDVFLHNTIGLDNWRLKKSICKRDDTSIYLNYESYFERIGVLLEELDKGDMILMVGYEFGFDEDSPLILRKGKSAQNLIKNAYIKGVSIHLLCSGGKSPKSVAFLRSLNTIRAVKATEVVVKEDYGLSKNNDHHQKAVFIQKQGKSFLFLGGMDLTHKRVGINIDCQIEINGDTASLGYATLLERYNNIGPQKLYLNFQENFTNNEYKPESNKQEGLFQFVRSYEPVPKDGFDYGPAPKRFRKYVEAGERSYYDLVSQAISSSKESIYFEDQFFESFTELGETPKELDKLLLEASEQNVKVCGIGSDYKLLVNEENKGIERINNIFLKKPIKSSVALNFILNRKQGLQKRSDKIFPFIYLLGPLFKKENKAKTFMHSKIWIFDDKFIVIGSANYWRSSYLPNCRSEFGVGFYFAEGVYHPELTNVSYAKGLRLKLWERIRKEVDSSFKFSDSNISNFGKEFETLIAPLNGKEVFITPGFEK